MRGHLLGFFPLVLGWPIALPATSATPADAACKLPCRGCQTLISDGAPASVPHHATTDAERAILSDAFARYLTGPDCRDDAEALKVGDIGSTSDPSSVEWRIEGAADGAFTAPGLRETLFLFRAGMCGNNGFHVNNGGVRLLVIVRDGRAVASFPSDGQYSQIRALTDVDGDGTSDVVLAGGFTNTGWEIVWAAVHTFAGGRDRTISDLGDVAGGDCTGGRTGRWASTIVFRPGRGGQEAPCFRATRRRFKCDPL
jgi:hypothetical protein